MTHGTEDLDRYLSILAGEDPAGRLIEIRSTIPNGMRQTFTPATRPELAASTITRLAARTDVYVGVLLRRRHDGGRDACESSHLAFIEIDRPDAVERLTQHHCPPTMIIGSGGSIGHAHAYWQLHQSISLDELETANRRLAIRLGGDLACVDAARILRPPSTRNWKRTPPSRVELLVFEPSRRYTFAELTAGLGNPPPKPRSASPPTRGANSELDRRLLAIPAATYVPGLTGRHPNRAGKISCPFHELSVGDAKAGGVLPARSLGDASLRDRFSADPLLLVPPPVYFERLTGLRVGRSGKLRCLFHDDQHPSLHVYPEAGRGWYCFGCGRGGSVYDLAALLSGRKTRGADFLELRRELEKLLL
jgi:hypothetical protein